MANDKLMQYRAAALAGRSPRQAGADKAREALRWVYRWGWSSASTIDGLTSKRRGLAARLVKHGLLARTTTESGGVLRGVPTAVLTLTPSGLAEVERELTEADLLPYSTDPAKVRQEMLRHDGLTQSATAAALRAGTIVSYQTPAMLAVRSATGVKQPDAIWTLPSGQRIAVEVELTAKWGRRVDEFVRSVIEACKPEGGKVDFVALVSDSRAILDRYSKALKPGASVGIWEKDSRGHWHQTSVRKVPDWMEGKVLCRLIDS